MSADPRLPKSTEEKIGALARRVAILERALFDKSLPTQADADELYKTLEACEELAKKVPSLEEADEIYKTLEAAS